MLPGDQIAYLTCLLLSFPLSQFYWAYFLPKKGLRVQKQLYFAFWGHFFLFLLFIPNYHQAVSLTHPLHWVWHVYSPTVFTYAWTLLFRGRLWMPYINFAVLIAFTAYLHCCRYWWQYGEYRLDHITVVMLLVIKLSSFAFDINDAYRKQRKRLVFGRQQEYNEKVKPAPLDQRLDTLNGNYYPSILEFLAYCFMYSGVLTGPAIYFPEFKSFLDGTYFQFPHSSNQDKNSIVNILNHSAQEARRKRIKAHLIKASIFIALHLTLTAKLPPSFLVSDEFYENYSFPRKLLLAHITNFAWRTKYYLAWLLSECAHVVLGLGYRCTLHTDRTSNLTTVHHTWDRLEIVDPLKVESAHNFRLTLGEWHKTTNDWLYRYVYLRIRFLNNARRGKPGFRANLFTKLVSALWHGVYPGYFITFGTAALYTWASHLAFRTLAWPKFIPTYCRYWLALIANYSLTDYVIATFELWPIEKCLAFYRNFHYFGHILLFSGIVLMKFYPHKIKHQ